MFAGKTVLITGSNRGIGKATLEAFAKKGANIIAHARKETSEFEENISMISKVYGINIIPIYFDMTDFEIMKERIKELFKSVSVIDVLVNNSGIAHGGFFAMTPVSKIKEVFEVNLFSHMQLTQLILKKMMREKSGSIINLASIAGQDLSAGNCAYGVSKAAIAAWTKTLSAEVASYGIRVNAVAPGLSDTNMANQMEEKAKAEMINSSAMKRLGHPEEIANVICFLASEEASFVNGQIIRVDGGTR